MNSQLDFTYKDIKVKEFLKIYKNGGVVIPKYQRSIKWDMERKLGLLSSLKKGNPMGAILVYKELNSNSLRLIDGLQRMSSIIDYTSNIFNYIQKDDISMNMCEEIAEVYKGHVTFTGLDVRDKIYDIIKNNSNIESDNKLKILIRSEFKPFELAVADILSEYNLVKFKELLLEYPIIMIVYNGDEENLPEIFHSLNTGAVNLTKYEVISSIWNDYKLKFPNDKNLIRELNDQVEVKYENMRKDGFEFEWEDSTSEEYIYLFDFCEALGGILASENKNSSYSNVLFSKKKEKELGFELLALIFHGTTYTDKRGESKKFKFTNPEHLANFLNKDLHENEFKNIFDSIIKCTREINKILTPFYYKNGSNNTLMQGYAAKHLFISIYRKMYDISYENKQVKIVSKKRKIDKLSGNIVINVLNDVVSSFWAKNRQITDFILLIENDYDRYDTSPSKDAFLANLNIYIHDITGDNAKKYSSNTIKDDVKIITYALHMLYISTNIEYKNYYNNAKTVQFDHYHAKSWFKGTTGIPYSSVLNIWPIPPSDNGSKSNRNMASLNNTFIKGNEEYNTLIGRPSIANGFENISNEGKKEEFIKFMNSYKRDLESSYSKLYEYLMDLNS